ncbi:hypothetical protein HTG_14215 [Natrinema mahii]|nr:hypothetical protein HTG_14215 [Natrinema mahii]
MSEQRFLKCTKDAVEEFSLYDRNVDIVTCWESFSRAYQRHFQNFNFDRFPSYKTQDDGWMNPNFTMYFDQRYGVAFVTYHRSGIAKSPALFEKEVQKIKALDDDLKFERRDGRMVEPKEYDICILVNSSHSQTLAHKLEEKIEEDELSLDGNIVVLEFDYLEEDESKYRFKRVPHPDLNFRDDVLPNSGSISRKLSIKGGTFENIQIPLDENFSELKATGVFTNRPISELYLACRLWDTVIKDKLSDDEWEIWRKGDPKKTIPKKVSCSKLQNDICNKYVPGATITEDNIEDALKYIAVAKRAVQVSDDEFRVKYSNLIEKRREHKDAASERSDIEDLAYLLASWHCETKVGNSLKDIADMISSDNYGKADLSGITEADVMDY